jgi:hypothetical protein
VVHSDIGPVVDVGGFGVASDVKVQGTAMVGYHWTNTIASSFGYKALYADYDEGGFRYDATHPARHFYATGG